MDISQLMRNSIIPFEIEDDSVKKLFSFFLHSAPTIDSRMAACLDEARLQRNWNDFISYYNSNQYVFLAAQCIIEKYFPKYGLETTAPINRKSKAFVCKRKDQDENDYTCFLRHIRNAIAHSRVYMLNTGNRKYLLFEDFNKSKNQSARILMSQTDLKRLKDIIMK